MINLIVYIAVAMAAAEAKPPLASCPPLSSYENQWLVIVAASPVEADVHQAGA